MLALEAVKKLVPKNQRTMITQEFLDKIEASVQDSLIAEQFKENFITYLNVLSKGKYKMEDYISAIKYVSYKLLGYTNIDAYAATFPERYNRLKKEGQQKIDAFVAMYMSKRSWTPELDSKIRRVCNGVLDNHGKIKGLNNEENIEDFNRWLEMLLRMGRKNITVLRYIDISIMTEGIHRAGQD